MLNPWPFPFNKIAGFIGFALEPWIFKIFYRNIFFITVSNSTKKDLIAWGIRETNISVIHNGVKLFLPKPLPSKEKRKTAMFLGAIAKDKGIEDALQTFSLIQKENDDWQFWVVGKSTPAYLRLLKRRSRELYIKNIKFWGFVTDKKKFELLARAHVLINPSFFMVAGLLD